jgi:hypothetical protein
MSEERGGELGEADASDIPGDLSPEPAPKQTRGQRRREREQAELRELREANRTLQEQLFREETGELDDLDEPEELESDEVDPELEEPAEEPAAPSGGRQRIESLRAEAERRDEEMGLLRAQIERITAPQQPPPIDHLRQVRAEAEELEQVEMLPAQERDQYWYRRASEEVRVQLLRQELQLRDLVDRTAFASIMRDRNLSSSYSAMVENTILQYRQQGMNPSREQVLDMLIGREVREKSAAAAEEQRRHGQRRIASQKTRPSATGSTAAAPAGRRGQNQAAEDEALLRNITVGQYMAQGG